MHRRPPIRAAWSLLLLSSLFVAVPARAATIASVSPQGEVAQVRQVTVKFSEAVVAFGDPRLPDPAAVQCEGAAPAGAGRWASDRVWLYDFREALGPGVRCTLKARPDWKPGVGGPLGGRTEFTFSTGGPALLSVRPWPGSDVAEDQHFLLELSGPAVEASVAAKAWCEVDGIGDRLPLRVVTGAPREQLLKSQRITAPARVARTLVVACGRPLPGDTPVRLVWGRGIAAAANPAVLTRVDQRQAWRVRKPFTADFSCERERANAPCLPIRAMRLQFSAPVARALAEQLRLQPVGGGAVAGPSLAPVFDKDDKSSSVTGVEFPKPLAENAAYTVLLPPGLKDDADRPLANAASFPLKVATGAAPPIARFAAAPFGVLEFESADGRALLPLTLRHVQGDLRPAAPGGQVRVKRIDGSDADLLAWIARVQRHHERELTAREAGLPERDWFDVQRETDAKGRVKERKVERSVASREIALLAKEGDATRLDLPALQGGDPRPFEVIGLPIAAPGYHVVEVASARLGQALLDKAAPMYVRTGVLATNLGVHFKHGRQDSLVWVTQLDRGRPVDGADVAISDCRGKRLWAGRTDAQGIARVPQALDDGGGEDCLVDDGLLVTARKAVDRGPAKGQVDLAFVFSGWQKGIESWRYDLPMSRDAQPDVRAHTVFDRTLLRAGETVSMKHFVRGETSAGLAALPAADLPTRVKIVHQGSGQEQLLPLQWAAPGARSAVSAWKIPPSARLGAYDVLLERESADERRRRSWVSGSFRVEEFRVPLVDARLSAPKAVPPASRELSIGVQLNYQSGGGVAQAPLRASALLKDRALSFDGYEGYVFTPPRDVSRLDGAADEDEGASPRGERGDGRLVADKLALATDAQGAARVLLKDLPAITRASELLAEVTFNDPNGEVQTASTSVALWPSAVVLGVRAGSWVSARGRTAFTVVALDTAGKPLADQALEVRGRVTQIVSTRKRMVGGFYAYDNRQDVKDLGVLCSGRSDARGLLACDAELSASGQVELIAQARDAAGNAAQAAASVWVTRQGELWFAQDNDDRIDLMPEKRRYEVGETARLQVRMPFREATALLSVEREGVIATRVVTLRGDDPTVDLKIEPGWGPNVYVSVLALRGRIREVPWYSFFAWGWQSPVEWWRAWRHEGKDYQPPTALVDLARPAFKLGVAALQVGIAEHALQVRVTADKPQYAVRQKALARIQVTQGGQPVQGGEIAFAAVDEGLLALRDNDSWDLLGAMLKARPWGVETSTAQSEIVGRRHYGRKAVAAGGGGGRGATRELFDTLLLWQASVPLDARGEATVEVPLNDSLTSFRLVAVADAGVQRFGSGSTQIRVSQDLQLLPGLPPLVREGDRYTALMTLRNTTAREMKLEATLQGAVQGGTPAAIALPPQDLVLAAGAAKEITWSVEVPAEAGAIAWEAAAVEQGRAADAAQDRVKLVQRVAPAVPLRVFAATLAQVDGSVGLPVAAPADALPASGVKRGGLQLALQPRLSSALPGLRRYFETYPYSCLEQKASRAIGLRDAALWSTLANELPGYLDADGLAAYFPPRAQDGPGGSDRLTAYLIAAAHEAGYELPAAAREQMLDGLAAWVEGRIERRFQAPRADGDARRLAAIEALSRHGRAQPRMLGTVTLAPSTWPTAAVIDWLNILRRVPGIPDQARRLEEAQQVLRARLTWSGTTLKFSTEQDDFWWWLMDSADANASRLILALLDDPAWKDELPRLVVGSLGRQRNGAWLTTTANLWGSLALDKFSKKFESTPVAGRSVADTGGAPVALDWTAQPQGGTLTLPWPAAAGTLSVAQQGSGKPWLAVQGLAAVPLKAPLRAGYAITRSVAAVEQKNAGRWTRGDLMRVRLEIDAQADMGWVVVSDPVPAGAALLGSGLGRDSAIATRGEQREGRAWPAYEERGFEAFRSYYAWLPRGRHVVEYTLRLNNPGRFALPPSRVEAMYAPESFGESPNAMLEVGP
ncbi:MG2 domain-containing protein [uncultured Methylibium sp.]|uniref:alpha-2-macroglobulin family protein n=1 Tax=uncultured Methylibium sp. TaxID=381093 RepID=UPI002600947D|nr:MG2 domain-containing protein [uncultured Methylibium sp.]